MLCQVQWSLVLRCFYKHFQGKRVPVLRLTTWVRYCQHAVSSRVGQLFSMPRQISFRLHKKVYMAWKPIDISGNVSQDLSQWLDPGNASVSFWLLKCVYLANSSREAFQTAHRIQFWPGYQRPGTLRLIQSHSMDKSEQGKLAHLKQQNRLTKRFQYSEFVFFNVFPARNGTLNLDVVSTGTLQEVRCSVRTKQLLLRHQAEDSQ